ncbi:MAG: NAD-dependent epimerase/dehydratase family protein [Candidatus Portnoybacteria bacterium]|nr:NAD-dependent epimerase/dehydratase family protein [Candidatus Portnoybacteria bacterium]
MRCLVTGGAGFIGSHLVDELIKRGNKVIVIDNLSNGKKENLNPKAKFYKKDIRNLESVAPHFKGVDFVFHLAALPRVQFSIEHPIEANDNNINGTLNVLEAAKRARVKRVIFSSSSSIYGDQPKFPYKENMPPNPMSPYALHKYVGELYCKMYSFLHGLETVCLRYFNAYGPRASTEGAYALVTAIFLKQKKGGKPLTVTGTGKQSRDFTHVFDIVRANILAAQSKKVGSAEVINIGGGNDQRIIKVAKLFGGPIEFIAPRIEPQKTLADIRLAKKILNWEPKIKFEDGIKQLLKSNNFL